MPGPMASAASVDGANEPTARPSDVDANDSRVSTPQNFANLAARRIRSKSTMLVHADHCQQENIQLFRSMLHFPFSSSVHLTSGVPRSALKASQNSITAL